MVVVIGFECLSWFASMDGITDPFLNDYVWDVAIMDIISNPYGAKEVGQEYPNGYELFDIGGNL